MAVNNNIYLNAAYAGFIRGALDGRGTGLTAANLTALKTAAQAFAAQVDAGIAFDALVTTGASNTQLAITTNTIAANEQWRAGLLEDLCYAEISGRFSFDSVQANWSDEATKITTAWTALVAGLTTP